MRPPLKILRKYFNSKSIKIHSKIEE